MTPWFAEALLALLFIGLQRFFYKVAAERGCSTALTSLVFMVTVAAISWLLFLSGVDRGVPGPSMVLWGLVNGLAFLASAVWTMEALRRIPAAVGYSLTRLSTVFATLFSILYFHDRLRPGQVPGVILAIGVVVLCARRRSSSGAPPAVSSDFRSGVVLALLAMLAGAVSTVSSKFAALQADKWGFMAVAYSFSALAAFFMYRKSPEASPAPRRVAVTIGLIMGGFNLIGFYLFLQSLETGPLAIIAPLAGLHFVISILLSAIVYRERPDLRSFIGILLAVAAVLLMKA
jgi:drug/metabolite transporter (DMT)-like permease